MSGVRSYAFVARGDQFADALIASPYAYKMKMPILLVAPTALPSPIKSAVTQLGIQRAIIVGNTSAVSAGVASGLGIPVQRYYGAGAAGTSLAFAGVMVTRGWASWSFVGVGSDQSFPDSLGGGAATGKNGGVLLMTPPSVLSPLVGSQIRTRRMSVKRLQIYGGPPTLSESCATEIAGKLD
jgi:hypothetical protein